MRFRVGIFLRRLYDHLTAAENRIKKRPGAYDLRLNNALHNQLIHVFLAAIPKRLVILQPPEQARGYVCSQNGY